MATTYTADIQKLYVAYFNRPADAAGLQYWESVAETAGNTNAIAAAFAASSEYKTTYAGMSAYQIVATIYENLFGREADVAGLNFWAQGLLKGTFTIDTAVTTIAAGAQGDDTTTLSNKVAAATAFTNALDTTAEIIGYSGDAANNAAKSFLSGVTDTDSLNAAIATDALNASVAAVVNAGNNATGTTFNLTVGVDNIVGTAGNDIINASTDPDHANAFTLGGLDKIDGGAGVDTVNLTDPTATGGLIDLSTVSMTNVEKLNVEAVAGLASASVSVKGFTGLTDASIIVNQGAALTVTAATTTGLTVSNDKGVTIVGGGKTVAVVTSDDTSTVTIGKETGATSADKNAFTSASVTGAGTVSITDNSGASGAVGSTLTSVSLNSTGDATLTGNKLTNVSLSAIDGGNIGIDNTVAHAATLTVDGVTTTTITDMTATSVSLVGKGDDSLIALDIAAAKTLAVSGDSTVQVAMGAYDALTKVTYTGSGSFGALLDGADHLVTVDASGATGDLQVQIAGTNADGAAQSVTGGAGDDTVVITGTLGKGSVLSLGAGSDVVTVDGGEITGDAVVDAGAGNDTLSLAIVGDANVGAFKNFENFDVAGISADFDESVLDTLNTVQNFVGTDALAASAALINLGANVGFIVEGDMGNTNVLTLTQATAGALTITSNVDEAKADEAANTSEASFIASNATSLNLTFDNANVDTLADGYANTATLDIVGSAAKTLTIVSGGSEVVNIVNYTGAAAASSSTADVLTTVTITGDQALEFHYTENTNRTDALTSVDASGMTGGGLTIDLSALKAGGTIKLGGGDDIVNAGVTTDLTKVTTANVDTISGMAKAGGEATTATSGFDVISTTGAVQATDVAAADGGHYSIKDGVYTFIGAGASTLTAAVQQIATDLATSAATGETVAFTYAGNKYVFSEGADATHGLLVKVTGTTVTGLDVTADHHIYVF